MSLSVGEQSILSAIGAPHSQVGIITALYEAQRCLRAAAGNEKSPIFNPWLELLDGTLERLLVRSDGAAEFYTATEDARKLPTYGVFLTDPVQGTEDGARMALALMGRAIVVHASRGQTIPSALAQGLASLARQRSDMRARGLARELDGRLLLRPVAEIRASAEASPKPGLRVFLAHIVEVMSIPVSAPPRNRRAGTAAAQEQEAAAISPTDVDDDVDRSGGRQTDESDFVENRIGWLIQRANRCGFRQRFGAGQSWEAMTPGELKVLCARVAADLANGGHRSEMALACVITLVTSLPIRLAVHLPLAPDGDIWLGEGLRCVAWSLRRVLVIGAEDSVEPAATLAREEVVEIPLPAALQPVARELLNRRPGATTLGELLDANDGATRTVLIDRYRAHLRDLGDGWAHASLDARWASSLSPIYRARTGDVPTALLSLDFREVALGMIHYVRLPRRHLIGTAEAVYEALGLGPIAKIDASGDVGSTVALDFEAFAGGWNRLQDGCSNLRGALRNASTMEAACKAFTSLAQHRLLSVVTAIGGRGHHLERLTWLALYGETHLVQVVDKRLEAGHNLRGIPVHAMLREQLDAWLDDLGALNATCRRLKPDASPTLQRILERRRPGAVAFFGASVTTTADSDRLARLKIDRSSLARLAQTCFERPLNVGRHVLVSQLIQLRTDPWLIKTLTGHYRGGAHPFHDGGMLSPKRGLDELAANLDRLLAGLVRSTPPTMTRRVLDLHELPVRLPMPQRPAEPPAESRASVLESPWLPTAPTSNRLVDLLRHQTVAGEGPTHAGANLLLQSMFVNWQSFPEAQSWWHGDRPLVRLGEDVAVAVWQTDPTAPQQHALIDPRMLVALHRAVGQSGEFPQWQASLTQAAQWLRATLPHFRWPAESTACLRCLDAMIHQWLRRKLPPFLLTASAPSVEAPTASLESLRRLHAPVDGVQAPDTLVFASHATGRTSRRNGERASVLKLVRDLINKYGRTDRQLGEEHARWTALDKAAAEIDCSTDGRAAALKALIAVDCRRWVERHPDRIQVSSLATYVSLVRADLERIAPAEDLLSWHEEWHEWHDTCEALTQALIERDPQSTADDRRTAARHLLVGLEICGHSVPAAVTGRTPSNNRHAVGRAAASTVFLEADECRIRILLATHFRQSPLKAALADLYAAVSFAASMRTAETSAIRLDALTASGELIVCTDGFSHLKSQHARRLQRLPPHVVDTFKAARALVMEAAPDAEWLFLFDDPNDWSIATEIARAFGAALRQVSGDSEARPHSARAVAPLRALLPGFEEVARALARGEANPTACQHHVANLERQGVAHLVGLTTGTGHGHPKTYLSHYFAAGSWLRGVYANTLNARLADPDEVVRRVLPEARAAYRKAKQRGLGSGNFDGWSWLQRRLVAALKIPILEKPSQRHVEASAARNGSATHPTALILYTAARLTGLGEVAAMHALGVMASDAVSVEKRITEIDAAKLRARNQSNASRRGTAAEREYLTRNDTVAIAARFWAADASDLNSMAAWLNQGRRRPSAALPIDTLCDRLMRLGAILPTALSLRVQPRQGLYEAPDLARLSKLAPVVHLGPLIRDLGNEPCLSVVSRESPDNSVLRARLTAVTRCLLQAVSVVRDSKGVAK